MLPFIYLEVVVTVVIRPYERFISDFGDDYLASLVDYYSGHLIKHNADVSLVEAE